MNCMSKVGSKLLPCWSTRGSDSRLVIAVIEAWPRMKVWAAAAEDPLKETARFHVSE
jgi:hypothetical protein